MENGRSGNLKVEKMKQEIREDIAILEISYIHERAMRQILDGTKFLEMIQVSPYKDCDTVSQLKKKISEERNRLKEELGNIEKYMPGYQMSLFETIKEATEQEIKQMETRKQEILSQMRWLHKCLGMCINKKYFK